MRIRYKYMVINIRMQMIYFRIIFRYGAEESGSPFTPLQRSPFNNRFYSFSQSQLNSSRPCWISDSRTDHKFQIDFTVRDSAPINNYTKAWSSRPRRKTWRTFIVVFYIISKGSVAYISNQKQNGHLWRIIWSK
jgi:hypothetical protein